MLIYLNMFRWSILVCCGFTVSLSQVNCNPCTANCQTCNNSDGGSGGEEVCTSCNDGYWLSGSSCLLCPDNCVTCFNATSCRTCKPEFYQPDSACYSSCPTDCLDGECDDNTGHCVACPPDKYGFVCNFDCGLCKNEQCGLRKCSNGCKPGYWQYQDGDHHECRVCMANCTSCDTGLICDVCNDGTYLSETSGTRNYCLLCRTGCETCSSNNYCPACKPGYYGAVCQYLCSAQVPDDCYQCHWDGVSTVTCSQCVDGFTLQDNTCKVASQQRCPNNCESCTVDNVCEICKTGWYGALCDKPCHDIPHCAACQDTAGSLVCSACDVGYVVTDDECVVVPQQCSDNCESCTEDNVCEICKTGWYGALCDKPCHDIPHCVACQDTDGSIVCSLCNGGYKVTAGECGVTPTTSTSLPPSSSTPAKAFSPSTLTPTTSLSSSNADVGNTSNQGDNKSIMIGAIAGGVGLIILVAVLLTICLIKRRKTNDRNNQPGLAADGHHIEEDLADYPVYAKPNKATKSPPTEDYIYAQPNKLKKRNQQMTEDNKDESEELPTHNNVAISLDMEAVMAETNVDEIQLETLEGELISNIETGVDIPSSDTYYNVEGLLRSRVDVSNLLEYVRKKHDFDSEFQKLPKGLQRSCDAALRIHNRKKNRFNGIYAYDATRVVLGSKSYINANHIDGHNQSNAYIASLGPTSDTMNKFSTFWEMVWQEGVEAIVMLTNLDEHGKMKCEQYWPNPGTTKTYHDYTVQCSAETVFAEFAVRELTLERDGVSDRRSMRQYHYTAWPDRYVPETVASLVQFRDKVEEIARRTKSPIVVHCSAGIGRTGTYIALDLLIKEGRDCNYVDMFGCALGLRGQRVNLIQNEEQYEYLHHAVLYSLSCYTEPISLTSFHNLMSDERIAAQFKALKALPVPSKRLSLWTSNYTDRKENRAGADIPCDSHRVRLLSSNMDYINAVYINGYQRTNAYIAAQTPMPSTVEDFVSMVYAERCTCIISLDEDNTTLKSVAKYLPEVNETSMFGKYQIHCEGINVCDDYIIRDIVVLKTPSDKLTLQHYQFRKWKADDSVPSSTDAFLNLATKVASTVDNQHGPILIHCLTGSQRCGVYCAVATMLEKLAIDRYMTGIHTFFHIRSRRSTALQQLEMFKFCYHCVNDSINKSSNRDNYYNVPVPNKEK